MLEDKIKELVNRQSTKDISYVIEMDGQQMKHQEDKVYRSASVIKVPLCLAALNKAEAEDTNEMIRIENEVSGSGVLHSLNGVAEMSVRDLVALTIIVSDNTASNLLMDYAGFDNLAELFSEWGMKGSSIKRHFMDTSGDISKMYNVATARDMMTALNLVYGENEYISNAVREEMQKHLRNQQFNDRVGGALDDGGDEGMIKVSNKTGTQIKLEHDVGVLQSDEKTVKFSVLSTNWQSNKEARYFLNEVGEILLEAFK